MQLVRTLRQFDVIVTDNLFGDPLSDAAMLTGSLGMLPSASLGAPMANGRPRLRMSRSTARPPISLAGQANPIACILSFRMALRYATDLGAEADLLERAVERCWPMACCTADLEWSRRWARRSSTASIHIYIYIVKALSEA